MTYAKRQSEIERLRTENRAALSVALISDGAISSTQINRMGKREHAEWLRNVDQHFVVKAAIRELSKSDEQLATESAQYEVEAKAARIDRAERYIAMVEGLGSMSHLKNGKLKKSYQIAVDAELAVIAQLKA